MTAAEEERAVSRAPAAVSLPPFATRSVASVAALVAAVLTALSARYGFHRDELYFLAAGHHPAWGYTDQPPLTPLIARAATAVFGDTPQGLRVPATLMCAAAVVVTAAVAREFGGGRRAQVLAAGCAAAGGYGLAVGHMVSTASFDLLAWLALCWLGLRLLRTGDGRWWAAIGAVAGVSLLNKYLVVLLVAALLLAIAAVGQRAVLRGPWLWAGVALAGLIALPSLWWQATHDWPQWTVARGISSQDGAENRILFVPEQIVYLSPLFVPLWLAGIRRLWREPELRWARSVPAAYGVLCVLVVAVGGKPYYALPLLLVLTAAGCGRAAAWGRRGWHLIGWSAAVSALISLPLLPPAAIGVPNAVNPEQGEQIGWPALADAAASGWRHVPPEQRARAVVFAANYGEAGALWRYGPGRGLPYPYSGHMAFADWGPPPDSADGPVLLVRQKGDTGFGAVFAGCRAVARVDNGHGVDNEEQGAVVDLCTRPIRPWSQLWPLLRHFY